MCNLSNVQISKHRIGSIPKLYQIELISLKRDACNTRSRATSSPPTLIHQTTIQVRSEYPDRGPLMRNMIEGLLCEDPYQTQ